ncbi:MAG: hypothetical protein WD118_06850 [Phycisphaeraceae bacterium]
MKTLMTLACLAVLAGCAATPDPPPPLPIPVLCALPAGMTDPETPPDKPEGDYTQRDVSLYIAALHRWGAGGWKNVAAARQWSTDCVDGKAVRNGGGAD